VSRARTFVAALGVAFAASCGRAPAESPSRVVEPLAPESPGELRGPEEFASIAAPADRSRAIFREASRVMLSPRCLNCHPAGDSPTQGDVGQLHDPPVVRGPDDRGVPGLYCTSCHQDQNATIARVPGAPKWQLAPRWMAWAGKTPGALCDQLKDQGRNGHRSLEQVAEHAAHDPIVAWGWAPGAGRAPVPGTQERFGALVSAWIRDGAACPREEIAR
jgi:hypothetical protein